MSHEGNICLPSDHHHSSCADSHYNKCNEKRNPVASCLDGPTLTSFFGKKHLILLCYFALVLGGFLFFFLLWLFCSLLSTSNLLLIGHKSILTLMSHLVLNLKLTTISVTISSSKLRFQLSALLAKISCILTRINMGSTKFLDQVEDIS